MTAPLPFSQALRQWMDIFMHRTMGGWARYVKASGFSMPQFFLLMHLHRHTQCGISDLSEHLDVTAAAASQLVDKLVQSGLLTRAEDPHDRRAKKVALSPKGRVLIERGVQERFRWAERLETSLSEAEKEKVKEALIILIRTAETMEEPLMQEKNL